MGLDENLCGLNDWRLRTHIIMMKDLGQGSPGSFSICLLWWDARSKESGKPPLEITFILVWKIRKNSIFQWRGGYFHPLEGFNDHRLLGAAGWQAGASSQAAVVSYFSHCGHEKWLLERPIHEMHIFFRFRPAAAAAFRCCGLVVFVGRGRLVSEIFEWKPLVFK